MNINGSNSVIKEDGTRNGIERSTTITNGAVYITNPYGTDASKNFVHLFQAHLKEYGISTISAKDVISLDKKIDLIVVCNNYSRIVPNFDSCLACVKGDQYKNTVVIVMHVGHGNPTSTEDNIRTEENHEKFKDLRKIIDMMYDKDMGIYPCNLNTGAYNSIKQMYQSGVESDDKCCSLKCCILS